MLFSHAIKDRHNRYSHWIYQYCKNIHKCRCCLSFGAL